MSVPGVPYTQFFANMPEHRKTRAAARHAGVPTMPNMVGHIMGVLAGALVYAPDGDLTAVGEEEVEYWAGWSGDPGVLYDALKQAGFIDPDDRLHEWDLYGGAAHEVRTYWRKQKAAQRERRRVVNVNDEASGTFTDDRDNSRPSRHQTKPDQTQQHHGGHPRQLWGWSGGRRAKGGLSAEEILAMADAMDDQDVAEVEMDA